jgi:hypothetical protein
MHPAIATPEAMEKHGAAPRDELRAFRNLVRSLTADATQALGELQMWCQDAEQLERCCLVRHYLDYMRRLCEGKV